jgi:hypothetical protein
VVVFSSVAGGGWSYRSPAPRVMQVTQVNANQRALAALWARICHSIRPGQVPCRRPLFPLLGCVCLCLPCCCCWAGLCICSGLGLGRAFGREVGGWRLAAGGWRLAAGASEHVHCLALGASPEVPIIYYLLSYLYLPLRSRRKTQDADKTQQDAGKLHFGPSTCPADQDPWISRAAMGPPVDTCRPISQLPTTHTLHTAHCTQTFPGRPAHRPLSSPACHPPCRVLFTAVQFGSLLSSPIKSSRLHLSHQTRPIADVIASLLLALPCERDQNISIDSSLHRHTGHQSPTFAFATRVLFCLVWFSLVQHAVYSWTRHHTCRLTIS